MSKRARTTSTGNKGRKRPIDKKLVGLRVPSVTNGASGNLIYLVGSATPTGASSPCTITGLRWELDVVKIAGAVPVDVVWALVVCPQGKDPNAINLSSGSTIYEPEQDCLAYGRANLNYWVTAQGGSIRHFQGATKAMRKLKVGDRFVFIVKADADATVSLGGVVQFFLKY